MAKKEKIILNYIIANDTKVKGRVIIALDGTGLDLNNPDHKHFLDIIVNVMGSQMYAKANEIPMENVKF